MTDYATSVGTSLENKYSNLFKKNTSLSVLMAGKLTEFNNHVEREISTKFDLSHFELLLEKSEQSLLSHNKSNHIESAQEDYKHYTQFVNQAKLHLNPYWGKVIHALSEKVSVKEKIEPKVENKHSKDQRYFAMVSTSKRKTLQNKVTAALDPLLTRTHLLGEWRKQIEQKRVEWELNLIHKLQQKFLEKMEEWLRYLSALINSIDDIGFDLGYFLDFSKGELSESDIEQIKKWLNYIQNDKGAQLLCDLLGKIRQVSHSDKIEIANKIIDVPSQYIDSNSKEEIVGIKLGQELEHVLPSEFALLSDPSTSILFDLKYIESRLMCFDMVGIQNSVDQIEIEEEVTVQEENTKGPMVICVDTSGSMHGSPEAIAKAVTLFLSSTAQKEKRDCYLINFSTSIETLDLSGNYSIKTLIDFLRKSFHGGTDVAPAINHGLKVMQNDTYENADMLIISDFVMSYLPDKTVKNIGVLRESGNRFYSLCIGNAFMSNRLSAIFDREWIYNPATTSIKELIGFQCEVENAMKENNVII
ncbi:von Willebrand factor, type A [Psychromonas ingrahamii 37]|uniref:von Willebrand factor, type A n=1 Tax=Psychromonas ingrahamii (strain DSM 17664 / CCUG 51855 / 37) TaxID=357804 RepID=A1SXM0_PSYIN|nr:VWA domain-containing protein [Psychromonas ingrahamii]ABM04235.1 von Willebrand factor, type A [Psychromonas ingrahamii 37]